MPADVLERRQVAGRALGDLAQQQLAVRSSRQMAALAVGRRPVGHLHQKWQPPLDHVSQDTHVEHRPQVVGIRDESVLISGSQQPVERAAGHQGHIQVAVAGRAPLQLAVVRPAYRAEVSRHFGLFVLLERRGNGPTRPHSQLRIAGQQRQRFRLGGEAVHQQQRRANTGRLPGNDVKEGQIVLYDQQRLRPGQAHARAQAAVELDDDRPAERSAAHVGQSRRELLGVVQRADRPQVALGDQAILAPPQLIIVVGKVVYEQVRQALGAHGLGHGVKRRRIRSHSELLAGSNVDSPPAVT